jgi:hypothetical protein
MKKLIIIILMFYAIALFGYIVGGVFLLDNSEIRESVKVEYTLGGVIRTTQWRTRNVGYEPTISYWLHATICIGGIVIALNSDKIAGKPLNE